MKKILTLALASAFGLSILAHADHHEATPVAGGAAVAPAGDTAPAAEAKPKKKKRSKKKPKPAAKAEAAAEPTAVPADAPKAEEKK